MIEPPEISYQVGDPEKDILTASTLNEMKIDEGTGLGLNWKKKKSDITGLNIITSIQMVLQVIKFLMVSTLQKLPLKMAQD